nr:MAG TPA: Radical SAM superfamily [Caudoviricetes sp.]
MIDCSKTVNYLSEKLRMTKRTKDTGCNIRCIVCPLSYPNNGALQYMTCSTFETLYPKEAIKIVQEWSNANPQKTYLSEFLQNYPNAELDENGIPNEICPHALGLKEINECGAKENCCAECWNQVID